MRFNHLGIKASDLKKSLDFYTRIMGLEIIETVDVGKPFIFVGNEHTLIEIEEANPNDQKINVDTGCGPNHMAFIVDDVVSLVERMKAEGVKIIMEPIQLRPDRKVSFIEDPDGWRIQFIELLK